MIKYRCLIPRSWRSVSGCQQARPLAPSGVRKRGFAITSIIMMLMIIFFSNLVNGRDVVSNIVIPSWGVFVLPPLGPTWYIRTLFCFVVLSLILVSALRRSAKITLGASFLAYAMFYLSEDVPFGTWRAIANILINLEGLAYFLVGIKIAMDHKQWYDQKKFALPLLVIALSFTIVRIYCKSTGNVAKLGITN